MNRSDAPLSSPSSSKAAVAAACNEMEKLAGRPFTEDAEYHRVSPKKGIIEPEIDSEVSASMLKNESTTT